VTNDIETLVEEVGRLYPAIYRRFHVSHRPLEGSDVTPRMLWLLQHLAHVGPSTLGELAAHLGIKKSSATELVDRLERKGLVDRLRDERDARRVFVGLTRSGQRRASERVEVLEHTELREAIAAMTPAERAALVRGMRALVRAGKKDNDEV